MESNEISRRHFLAAGAGTVALGIVDNCCTPARASLKLGTHHIPADKNLDPAWVERLFQKGSARTYACPELTCIGMPVGGICAGQLYLRGDGTLAEWGIFNVDRFTGYGDTCYRTYTPPSPVQQGFGITVTPRGGSAAYRTLDSHGFPNVEFAGEYPIGKVHYRGGETDTFPVGVELEAFSPYIPLDARESGTPGTVLRYIVHNTSDKPVDVDFGGWIQNPVGAASYRTIHGPADESRRSCVRNRQPRDEHSRGSSTGRRSCSRAGSLCRL